MMRRAGCLVLVVAFGLPFGGGGCDGGSGGGPITSTPIPTSVPGSKRISDLTPAERDQLCADLTAWAMSGPFLTDGCNASSWLATYLQSTLDTAATDADLQTACQGLYSACVAGGVTSMCSNIPSTCTATVAEYDTCFSDSTAALGGIPPCSSVTRASLASNVARLTNPPSSAACNALQSKCPTAM